MAVTQWWNPASWFVPSPSEVQARIDEVREHSDRLTRAIGASREVATSWGLSWVTYAAATESWAQEAEDDIAPSNVLAVGVLHAATLRRVQSEALDRLRALRRWREDAEGHGIEVAGPAPPDLVDLGLAEVPRWLVWTGGGLVAVGAAVLVSREGRAWTGRRLGNPRRRRRSRRR